MFITVRSEPGRYEVADWPGRDLSLSRTILEAGASTRGHDHPHEETYVFVRGEGVLELDGTAYSVRAGSAFLVGPSVFHRVKATMELEFYCTFPGERDA